LQPVFAECASGISRVLEIPDVPIFNIKFQNDKALDLLEFGNVVNL